jgi:uncharacterized cupredoxin-like copper-binding protein
MISSRFATLALAASLALATPALSSGTHSDGHGLAFGKPGDAHHVDRTVEIDLTDNAYNLAALTVRSGETIRFSLTNSGDFVHEFNIGTVKMHGDHQGEMAMMMENGMMTADHYDSTMKMHDDPNSIILNPGDTAELIWTFKKAHNLQFACNIPGHYESGMVGDIRF